MSDNVDSREGKEYNKMKKRNIEWRKSEQRIK